MVRINLINPKCLADQHLVAEYDEILMLLGYVIRFPQVTEDIPKEYCLGKGHIKFFKNKLGYIKTRHEALKDEMRKRGFATNKTIDLKKFNKELINDWKPSERDKKIIRQRIIEKLRKKPKYYRYYGKDMPVELLVELIEKSD